MTNGSPAFAPHDDFSGIGASDILWRNANGDIELYLSNSGSGFTGFSAVDLGVTSSAWSIAAIGDYNGDGKDDILWRNSNGDVVFWLSKSGAGYTGFTSLDNGVVSTDWSIVGDSPPPLGSVPGAQTITSAALAAPSAPPSHGKAAAATGHHAGGTGAAVAHPLAVMDPGSTTFDSATASLADQHGGDVWRAVTLSDAAAHVSNSFETGPTVADPFLVNLHAHSDLLFG